MEIALENRFAQIKTVPLRGTIFARWSVIAGDFPYSKLLGLYFVIVLIHILFIWIDLLEFLVKM